MYKPEAGTDEWKAATDEAMQSAADARASVKACSARSATDSATT